MTTNKHCPGLIAVREMLAESVRHLGVTFENEDASTDLKETTKNSGEDLIQWIKVIEWH